MIGAIIPTIKNAIFARGLQAFHEALRQSGIMLLVASPSYRMDSEEEQIRALVARGANGLLLIGHQRDPDSYPFLRQRGVPVLVAWAFDTTTAQESIGFDNRKAMQTRVREVVAHGRRRLAMISAPLADSIHRPDGSITKAHGGDLRQ